MGKINILDSSVYNQISAGEVVENPASVVKELVENSIDAGASSITVAVEDGGIKSISVVDNGCGIEREDLPKTVLPHATSKITTAKDLLTIGTLGFRGEALASIAAVSEIILKSKYIDAENAFEISVKAGVLTENGATNLSEGTSITINNLFFNTPARYKFLKTQKGEESAITKLMQEFIFSNPNVSFRYYIDNNICYQTDGDGLDNAVYAIYSSDIAENLIPFNQTEKSHTVSGFISRPATEAIGANRNRQILIVNGRIIQDNTLSMVIQNAYGESLMKRTFPTVILEIVMPFELVDVNVHPNKKEVRFANKNIINGLVYNAVKLALEKDHNDRQQKLFESVYNVAEIKYAGNTAAKENTAINNYPNYGDGLDLKPVPVAAETFDVAHNDEIDIDCIKFNDNSDREKLFNKVMATEITKKVVIKETTPTATPKMDINFRIIGQLFDTYILIECQNELLIIDQHATHERMLYDKLLSQSGENIVVQDLLFPYVTEINDEIAANLNKNLPNLKSLGFEFEIKGNKISLKAIPYLLINMDVESFMTELVEECDCFAKLSDIRNIREKLAKMACKKAIKGGDRLDDNQLSYVINYFFEKGLPLQCPHGRPTIAKFTKTELEKLFRRIV